MSNREDNKKRMMLALAVMLGADVSSYEQLADGEASKKTKSAFEESKKLYEDRKLAEKIEVDDRVPEQEIQIQAAKAGFQDEGSEYFKIVNVGDERTCDACKQWIGEIVSVSGNDPRYKTVDEFIKSGGLHPNCRCSLQKTTIKAITPRGIEKLAMNSAELNDEELITGFCDPATNGQIETFTFGNQLVQLFRFGTYKAYSPTKKEVVEEILDEEACRKIISNLDGDVLVDKDHSSINTDPSKRSTEAYAWANDFKIMTDLGNFNGLWCRLNFTSVGRKMVEEKIYRFLSPTFKLDEDGRAIKLTSIALTNTPNLQVNPIINSSADSDDFIMAKKENEMTEQEIKDLVIKTVNELSAAEKAEEAEKTVEDVKKEEAAESEKADEKEAEVAENECKEADKAEVENEEAKAEDKPEAEAEKAEAEKAEKKEVVKLETLNSIAPDEAEPEWKKLSGKAFCDYIQSGKYK